VALHRPRLLGPHAKQHDPQSRPRHPRGHAQTEVHRQLVQRHHGERQVSAGQEVAAAGQEHHRQVPRHPHHLHEDSKTHSSHGLPQEVQRVFRLAQEVRLLALLPQEHLRGLGHEPKTEKTRRHEEIEASAARLRAEASKNQRRPSEPNHWKQKRSRNEKLESPKPNRPTQGLLVPVHGLDLPALLQNSFDQAGELLRRPVCSRRSQQQHPKEDLFAARQLLQTERTLLATHQPHSAFLRRRTGRPPRLQQRHEDWRPGCRLDQQAQRQGTANLHR